MNEATTHLPHAPGADAVTLLGGEIDVGAENFVELLDRPGDLTALGQAAQRVGLRGGLDEERRDFAIAPYVEVVYGGLSHVHR
ncbi:hypothetical protein, partial [Novosphingobium resinovorum]|uniref:hypothetical protein n=1 Tax=Novosphingobium resinovorum TaxID=158500 RepID=UPI003D2BFCC1